ncbi:isocitrate lyase/phosphoenolpyruvate mutase family protein [Granulosicoccus sp.]|nr:isocitrate lyase/phosphoenolpyruvate mutase family protein [Granulosicoccus sp.]MDB4223891.1 isocitrate lyase/phosphoenolpyruvate mutase family protein [Granulosicoccus sp.]
MQQAEKANKLKALHVAGSPLVLYNIWDAGSSRVLARNGAKAIATGSWSVAAAQGYRDGEFIPLDFVLMIVERITKTTDLPVTVDFEGGYAVEPEPLAVNVTRIIQAGAVGINFEDQIVGGSGLHSISDQVERIEAVRKAATDADVPLFINARTDLFLKESDASVHASLIDDAIERMSAFDEAGADGFFVPGLTDKELVREVCAQSSLPVNVMVKGDLNNISEIQTLGVSRISFGPGPYFSAVEDLTARVSMV